MILNELFRTMILACQIVGSDSTSGFVEERQKACQKEIFVCVIKEINNRTNKNGKYESTDIDTSFLVGQCIAFRK